MCPSSLRSPFNTGIGWRTRRPRKEKLRLGQLSLVYAQRATALAPEDAEAQLSTAIFLGKMVPYQSSREQLDASPRIKLAVDQAIKLDPDNDIAWHVLGRWHQGLAEARKLIEKGLAMPNLEEDDPESKEHGREELGKLR